MAQQVKVLSIKIRADLCPSWLYLPGIISIYHNDQLYVLLEIEPRTLFMLDKHSVSCVTSLFTVVEQYLISLFIFILQNFITNLRSGEVPDPTQSINNRGEHDMLFF